jgi:RNA polymerase sigma-32 factor
MNVLALREENIDRYVAEIQRYPLLTREKEQQLALRYRDHGDIAAAHELVVSNLRFVVKVAHEYKGYGFKLLDLIQEGNVGLMMAVKKFDPDKGYRLISYAVWWIRAQIRSYIVRSWSLVKMGTTFAQRKLFFSLRGEKSRHEQEHKGELASAEELAKALGVEADEVHQMELRLAARDFSLDAQLGEDGGATHLDMVVEAHRSQEDELIESEQQQLLRGRVAEAMETLNEKERYIVENRMLNDEPKTLQEIGDTFQVSRERVRQLESRVLKKLRVAFSKDDNTDTSAATA